MSLHAIRSPSNKTLWQACTTRFLTELGQHTGPTGYPSHIWLTHRLHRDRLYAEAANRGLHGWLEPPVAFLSELPRLFKLPPLPYGALPRRMLLADLASRLQDDYGFSVDQSYDRTGLEHAADRVFGELLPESVSAATLERTLESEVADDDFARRRNAWLVKLYNAYLEAVTEGERYDPRAVHGFVAHKIASGALPHVLGGARRLHIYGLTTRRARGQLLDALRKQTDVDVFLYLAASPPEDDEWAGHLDNEEHLDAAAVAPVHVQPAPDSRREFEFVALQIKRLVHQHHVKPHEIAVVARTGQEDNRLAHEILQRAGIDTTARIRTSFAEAPALKAILTLFRGVARDWPYRALRQVLQSAYFDLDVDLRSIDHLAKQQRVNGLRSWIAELEDLQQRMSSDGERDELRREGVFEDRLERDLNSLRAFEEQVRELEADRTMAEWAETTRKLLDPGWFDFRRRLCDDAGGRWEIVRIDQTAVKTLERTLQDWQRSTTDTTAVAAREWYDRLRRFLTRHEITHSTPSRYGVQIVEAHEAALVPFEHVFVVHANDGEFPRRISPPAFFSEEERDRLSDAGLPLETRRTAMIRERALWRAVTGATNVTCSYRTADANGVPLLPSLLVPEHDETREIPRTRFVWPEPFDGVTARIASVARYASARQRDEPVLIPLDDISSVRHGVLNAFAESERGGGSPDTDRPAGLPSPWNGEIRDPVVMNLIRERFGPERIWSASQLEQYAQCPFEFFIARVLRLDEYVEAEEHTNALTFGGVAHDVLERFYRDVDGLPDEWTAELEERLVGCFEHVCTARESERTEWLGLPTLWEVTKADLLEKLRAFIEWELRSFQKRRPYRCEYVFGYDEPCELTGEDVSGSPVTMRVRGRIDRVDIQDGVGSSIHHILDYKTGYVPSIGAYAGGTAFQAPLYMRAFSEREGVDVASGVYRSIKNLKNGAMVKWEDAHFFSALRMAFSVPARVRRGIFEARAHKKWQDYWLSKIHVARVKVEMTDGTRFDG